MIGRCGLLLVGFNFVLKKIKWTKFVVKIGFSTLWVEKSIPLGPKERK
jgi:hypothetical protein